MPRSKPGPFGQLSNLNRLCRSALVVDGLLATGRSWEDIAREVAQEQYAKRGLTPPTRDVVRRYFSLEFAPGLDPGYRAPLSYPAALALQYPEVRPMAVAPLLDLLFGNDSPKADQIARKDRFSDKDIAARQDHGEHEAADFMRLLNRFAASRRPGRPTRSAERHHWSLYQTLLIARKDLIGAMFVEHASGYGRRIRPIEEEVADLMHVAHIDALALLYGLVRESLEFTDHHRLATAVEATLGWLPNLFHLPECRRIAPLLARAVLRACDQAVPKRFSREAAFDRVRPGTWRDGGPLVSVEELAFRIPPAEDSMQLHELAFGMRQADEPMHRSPIGELDIEAMSRRIEAEAQRWLPTHGVTKRSPKSASRVQASAEFPFAEPWTTPLMHLTDLVRASLPAVQIWNEGSFWVIQHATRCAVYPIGWECFPLMLVDFGHLRGDPVTDRPISGMPWILAEIVWVEAFIQAPQTSDTVTEFLKLG